MPRYLYICYECGARIEESHSMGQAPTALACEECTGDAIRQFSSPMLNGLRHPDRIRDEQAVHEMRANEYAEDKAHAKWAEKTMQKLD